MVDGPVSRGDQIEISLSYYHPIIREEFSKRLIISSKLLLLFQIRWAQHKCPTPGCGRVVVFDGGMKAQHRICSALL